MNSINHDLAVSIFMTCSNELDRLANLSNRDFNAELSKYQMDYFEKNPVALHLNNVLSLRYPELNLLTKVTFTFSNQDKPSCTFESGSFNVFYGDPRKPRKLDFHYRNDDFYDFFEQKCILPSKLNRYLQTRYYEQSLRDKNSKIEEMNKKLDVLNNQLNQNKADLDEAKKFHKTEVSNITRKLFLFALFLILIQSLIYFL